jgi:hypothetical protein
MLDEIATGLATAVRSGVDVDVKLPLKEIVHVGHGNLDRSQKIRRSWHLGSSLQGIKTDENNCGLRERSRSSSSGGAMNMARSSVSVRSAKFRSRSPT